MAKDNLYTLNLTIVALVGLVAIVGLTAIVLNVGVGVSVPGPDSNTAGKAFNYENAGPFYKTIPDGGSGWGGGGDET